MRAQQTRAQSSRRHSQSYPHLLCEHGGALHAPRQRPRAGLEGRGGRAGARRGGRRRARPSSCAPELPRRRGCVLLPSPLLRPLCRLLLCGARRRRGALRSIWPHQVLVPHLHQPAVACRGGGRVGGYVAAARLLREKLAMGRLAIKNGTPAPGQTVGSQSRLTQRPASCAGPDAELLGTAGMATHAHHMANSSTVLQEAFGC